jgi:two-component system, cell cycle response regulator
MARDRLTLVASAALGALALVVLVAGAVADPHPVLVVAGALALVAALALAGLATATGRAAAVASPDRVTGLPVRDHLIPDLEQAIAGGVPHLLLRLDLDGFKEYDETFGAQAGDALLARLGGRLRRAARDGRAYRFPGDEFCVLAEYRPEGAELLIDRCLEALSDRGEGFRVGVAFGAVVLPDEGSSADLALRMVDRRLYAQKRASSSVMGIDAASLARSIAGERPVAGEAEPAQLAIAVGRRLGLGPDEMLSVARAAQLHDVGMLAMPDLVLEKHRLDESDWQLLRSHPVIGERLLTALPELDGAAELVRASHERWDGRGYPDGLGGDAIPLGARIVGVCAAYAAIVRRKAPGDGEAVAMTELRRCAGSQFDPAIVTALAEALDARTHGAGAG